jgi:hypothetical protein
MAEYIVRCPLSGHSTSVHSFVASNGSRTWRYECSGRNAQGNSSCPYVSQTYPGEGPVPIGQHVDGLAVLLDEGLLRRESLPDDLLQAIEEKLDGDQA